MRDSMKIEDIPQEVFDEIKAEYPDITYDLGSTITIDTVSRRLDFTKHFPAEEMSFFNIDKGKTDSKVCESIESYIARIDVNLMIVRAIVTHGRVAKI